MIRSRSQERGILYGSFGGQGGITLNERDVIIGRLRMELRAFSDLSQNYDSLARQKLSMEQNMAEFKNSKAHFQKQRERETVSAERNVAALRSELEQLRRELNSKTLSANDILGEAANLEMFLQSRHQQIQAQLSRQEQLRNQLEDTLSESKKLEQVRQGCEQQLNRLKESYKSVETENITLEKKIIEVKGRIQESRDRADHHSDLIDRYEQDNSYLDREVLNLLNQEQSTLAEISNTEKGIQEEDMKIVQLRSKQQKLQAQIQIRQEQVKQQRQRFTQLQQTELIMNQDFVALTDHLQGQNRQANFLIRRNGQVAELNDRLKMDLQQCQKHLQTVRKTNNELVNWVDTFRKQDQAIVTKISQRGREHTPEQKLMASRLTNVSSASPIHQL